MKITNQLIILSILAQSASAGTVCIWNEGKLIGLRTNGTVGFAIDGEPASNVDNDGDGVMDDGQTGVYSSINVDSEGSASLDLTGDDFDWALRFQMYDADGVFGFTENFDDSVQVSVTPILSNTDLASRGDAGPTHTDADSASSWNTRTFGNYDFSDGVGGGWFDVTVELDEKGGGAQSADGIGFGFFNGTSTFDTDFQGIGYASVNGQATFDTDPVSGASFGVFTISEDDLDNDGLPDPWETEFNLAIDDDGSVDPNNGPDGDRDSDGLTNLEEWKAKTSPNNPDTDNDGYKDGVEDGGGTFVSLSKTGTSPLNPDTDNDGLLDGVENPLVDFVDADQTGTDPHNDDTDGDGYRDGNEIAAGTDPTSVTQINPGGGFIANWNEGKLIGLRTNDTVGFVLDGEPASNVDNDRDGVIDDGQTGFYSSINVDSEDSASLDLSGDDFDWALRFQMYDADGVFGFTENFDDSVQINVTPILNYSNLTSRGDAGPTHTDADSASSWNTRTFGNYDFSDSVGGGWFDVTVELDEKGGGAQSAGGIGFGFFNGNSTIDTDFQGIGYESANGQAAFDFDPTSGARFGVFTISEGFDNSGIVINSVTREVVNGSVSVTITWNSREGQTYSVFASEDLALGDLALWEELDDGLSAAVGADVTSFTESGLPLDTKDKILHRADF
jgi:hypothetical protein